MPLPAWAEPQLAARAGLDAAAAFPNDVGYQDRADALRHMLLIGQLSQKVGPTLARGLGAAYEALDPAGIVRNPSDVLMDLHNNARGAALGAKTQDYETLLKQAKRLAQRAKKRRRGLEAALNDRPEEPVFLEGR